MSLFDFLKNYKDQSLYIECCEFEKIYLLYSKMSFATEIRKILEHFLVSEEWSGLDSYNRIDYAYKNKIINPKTKDQLHTVRIFGNYAHHYYKSLSENEKNIYNKNTKERIMITFISAMSKVVNKKEIKVKKSAFALLTNVFRYNDSLYKLERPLEPQAYSHFLFKKENDKSKAIVRLVFIQYLDAESRAKNLLRGTPIESHILNSDSIAFHYNDKQVLMLTLANNQYLLSEMSIVDAKTAIKILYLLLHNIISPMLTLDEGKSAICHRNINPNTVIIQTDDINKLSDFQVRLACFEHSKVMNADRTAHYNKTDNAGRKFYDNNDKYILTVNANKEGSINFKNSRAMDAYSIARLLIFLTSGSPTNIEKFKQVNEFNETFKDSIISYIETWKRGGDYFIVNKNEEFLTNQSFPDTEKFYSINGFYKLIEDEYRRIFSINTYRQKNNINNTAENLYKEDGEPKNEHIDLDRQIMNLRKQIADLETQIAELEDKKYG